MRIMISIMNWENIMAEFFHHYNWILILSIHAIPELWTNSKIVFFNLKSTICFILF